LELTAEGELVVMLPTNLDTGEQNSEITMQLRQWAKRDGTGVSFDSSTGFALKGNAVRSPDASWLLRSAVTLSRVNSGARIPKSARTS
jgi:Uma2 family endonuclease